MELSENSWIIELWDYVIHIAAVEADITFLLYVSFTFLVQVVLAGFKNNALTNLGILSKQQASS